MRRSLQKNRSRLGLAQIIFALIFIAFAGRAFQLQVLQGDKLKRLGLSAPRIKAIREIGKSVAGGQIDLTSVGEMEADDAHAALTALHGVGPWTADIYLLFCLGHADAFPAGLDDRPPRASARAWMLRAVAVRLTVQDQPADRAEARAVGAAEDLVRQRENERVACPGGQVAPAAGAPLPPRADMELTPRIPPIPTERVAMLPKAPAERSTPVSAMELKAPPIERPAEKTATAETTPPGHGKMSAPPRIMPQRHAYLALPLPSSLTTSPPAPWVRLTMAAITSLALALSLYLRSRSSITGTPLTFA